MKLKRVEAVILKPAQDNADTSQTSWFKWIWNEIEVNPRWVLVDPFARDCELASPNTNDLNPDTNALNNMCAGDYLQSLEADFADLVIFDPPFSERMANDHYDGFGVNLYSSDSKLMTKCLKDCGRIIKPGGYLLKFGFNINQPYKCFELDRLWMIEKVGHKTTTMVTLWKNVQGSIYDY